MTHSASLDRQYLENDNTYRIPESWKYGLSHGAALFGIIARFVLYF